jgi:peptidoglycan biosynthesis protein MviN/MurJ (putative lipid II flippase)
MAPLEHAGLALASAIGAWINLIALGVAARRRFGPLGGRQLAIGFARTLGAAVPLAAWCLALLAIWPHRSGTAREAAWLAAAIGGGGALYWLGAMLVGADERRALARMLPGRARMLPGRRAG